MKQKKKSNGIFSQIIIVFEIFWLAMLCFIQVQIFISSIWRCVCTWE